MFIFAFVAEAGAQKTGIFSGNGEWVSVGLSGAMKLILNAALTGE